MTSADNRAASIGELLVFYLMVVKPAPLAKFGAPIEGLSAKDFAEPYNFFRMGTLPVMVDIMPKISIELLVVQPIS